MSQADLLQAIAVTAELCGTNLSEPAARLLLQDLSKFDEQSVLAALSKCRRELKGRLTLAEVITRIDDGRPGAEEAWAMLPRDEEASVVWTQEMIDAWAIVRSMIAEGEMVPARMAFKEAYLRLVAEARDSGVKVKWIPSLGHNREERVEVVRRAVEAGRLTQEHGNTLLPAPVDAGPIAELLLMGNAVPLLQAQPAGSRDVAKHHIQVMKEIIDGNPFVSPADPVGIYAEPQS
jgi:hypothetical protein